MCSLLLFETLEYGPRQWHTVPLVADNFVPLVVFGLMLGISGQWTFTSQFSDSNSCFWSAYVCQNVKNFSIVWSLYWCLSKMVYWGLLWMLLSRGNTSGHSLYIWYFKLGSFIEWHQNWLSFRSFRFLGSLMANLRYAYREQFWSSKYSFISRPFSRWILWMPFLADLIYPLVFRGIWEREVGFQQSTWWDTYRRLGKL